MAKFQIPEEPTFSTDVEQVSSNDQVIYSFVNSHFERFLENDAALQKSIAGLEDQVGNDLNDRLNEIKEIIDRMKRSFQDGVDLIYNKERSILVDTLRMSAPYAKTPAALCDGCDSIYSGSYNKGKSEVTLSVSGRGVTASNGKSAYVNFAGSNGRVSIDTAAVSGKQSFDIPDGYATDIVVDTTKPYNAGYSAGNSDGYKQGYKVGYADGLMGGFSGKIITVYVEAGAWFGGEGWHTTRCGGNFVYSITSKKWILDSGKMYEPGDATPYIDWVSCPVDASGKIGDTITVQFGCNSGYGSQGPTTVTYKKQNGSWRYYSGNNQAGEAPYAKVTGCSGNW